MDELRHLIKENNETQVMAELKELHPADIAELIQKMDLEEAEYVVSHLDSDAAADTLMELDEDDRHRLLENMPNKDIAKQFVEHLDTDDAVDLIQELDKEDQEEGHRRLSDGYGDDCGQRELEYAGMREADA